jgi:hypothetical protein
MKTMFALSVLLIASVNSSFLIQGSPDLKTLKVAGVNPALAVAVQDALKKTYKPNPNPLMKSYVRFLDFMNFNLTSDSEHPTTFGSVSSCDNIC